MNDQSRKEVARLIATIQRTSLSISCLIDAEQDERNVNNLQAAIDDLKSAECALSETLS